MVIFVIFCWLILIKRASLRPSIIDIDDHLLISQQDKWMTEILMLKAVNSRFQEALIDSMWIWCSPLDCAKNIVTNSILNGLTLIIGLKIPTWFSFKVFPWILQIYPWNVNFFRRNDWSASNLHVHFVSCKKVSIKQTNSTDEIDTSCGSTKSSSSENDPQRTGSSFHCSNESIK